MCLFYGLFSAMKFTFLYFLLVLSLFKMAPKCSIEVLSSILKCKEAVMCLREKPVLDKLCLGMSYSAVGHEFNINKSRVCVK